MKALNIFWITLFVFSAALQYNDPDPYVWMPIYLYGAFLCYRALRYQFQPILYVIGLIVYVSYAVYLFFATDGVINWMNQHEAESLVQSMKATKPWIESAREFFGLLILVAALSINYIWLSRRNKLKNNTGAFR